MKHLKKFGQLNEGTLNEVFAKKSKSAMYSEDRYDPDLKELLSAISSVIENSPIAFDLVLSDDNFTITGPFGISMRIDIDTANNKKIGTKAYIDKTVIQASDPKSLWTKLQKSFEFKQFIKGTKIEKLRDGRVKNIIKSGKDKPQNEQDKLILDYLYYIQPEMITNKSDNTGPYATSGSSIRTYKYDLTPIVKAWTNVDKKVEFDNAEAQKIYDYMTKKGKDPDSGVGYWEGELTSEVKTALENCPLIDVEHSPTGVPSQYAVYTYTAGVEWKTRMEDMQKEVESKLNFKSKYLVDEKVSQYNVEIGQSGSIALVIKVETTVWYN